VSTFLCAVIVGFNRFAESAPAPGGLAGLGKACRARAKPFGFRAEIACISSESA
jgi:hypothetical protein